MSFPRILQIEPTNSCNFSCIMCMRNFFKTNIMHMDMRLYDKVIREAVGEVKRIDLYGQGEPLTHPRFIDMVSLIRSLTKDDVEIFFSTNGSLLNKDIANKLLLDLRVDEISFSVDTTDFAKLERIRIGAKSDVIFRNLKYVAALKKKLSYDFKLGVEVVVMKSNINDLPDLVRNMSEIGVDKITVSHLIPYTEFIAREAVYLTASKEILNFIGDIRGLSWDVVRRSVYEAFAFVYGESIDRRNELNLREIWDKAKEVGLEVNLPLLIENRDAIGLIKEVEKSFKKAKEIADLKGVSLELPEIFLSSKNRSCPYVEKEAMLIRSDGKVVPCFNFIYTHPIFVNNHVRIDKEVIMGDLNNQTIEEVWNSETYKELRERLNNVKKNVPWCGDCPFSTLGCWYTQSNEMDCYGNKPSCSECLYSANIAKCII